MTPTKVKKLIELVQGKTLLREAPTERDVALALDNLGNHTQAIQFYNKVLSIDPKNTLALNNKKQALAALNNQSITSLKSPSNQTTTAAR